MFASCLLKERKVNYSDLKVTHSDPKVTYSDPKMTYTDPDQATNFNVSSYGKGLSFKAFQGPFNDHPLHTLA